MLPYKAEVIEADGVVFWCCFPVGERKREEKRPNPQTKQIQTNMKSRAFWLKLYKLYSPVPCMLQTLANKYIKKKEISCSYYLFLSVILIPYLSLASRLTLFCCKLNGVS